MLLNILDAIILTFITVLMFISPHLQTTTAWWVYVAYYAAGVYIGTMAILLIVKIPAMIYKKHIDKKAEQKNKAEPRFHDMR